MDRRKQPYSSPALTELTRESAIRLIAKRKNCSEVEAARLLDSLRQQPPQDATGDSKPKRSA